MLTDVLGNRREWQIWWFYSPGGGGGRKRGTLGTARTRRGFKGGARASGVSSHALGHKVPMETAWGRRKGGCGGPIAGGCQAGLEALRGDGLAGVRVHVG